MKNKISLVEATQLALLGKLPLQESRKVKKECVEVEVDDVEVKADCDKTTVSNDDVEVTITPKNQCQSSEECCEVEQDGVGEEDVVETNEDTNNEDVIDVDTTSDDQTLTPEEIIDTEPEDLEESCSEKNKKEENCDEEDCKEECDKIDLESFSKVTESYLKEHNSSIEKFSVTSVTLNESILKVRGIKTENNLKRFTTLEFKQIRSGNKYAKYELVEHKALKESTEKQATTTLLTFKDKNLLECKNIVVK